MPIKIPKIIYSKIIDSLNITYIEHWITYSILIGIVAGTGAIILYSLIDFITTYVLSGIGGYYPPPSGGEISIFKQILHSHAESQTHPYVLAVIPAIGGLIVGAIIYHWAPEAEGHGTDAVINSFHNNRGRIRQRVPLIKAICSAITIGTGGSAGREGPVAQIGAGFGSIL
ncbi:MAG: chloride channel protein, partial [Methanosarcinales archaeon]